MGEDDPAADSRTARRGKVERLIGTYELEGMPSELEDRWTGDGVDRMSLRDLADFFNRALLAAAVESAGGQAIAGEIDNLYRLLRADDVSPGARAQATAKLSRMGVEVDSLQREFVTHQAVHTYLTKHRGVSAPTTTDTPEEAIESRRQTLQRLRNRLLVVTEGTLKSLRGAGHLTLGSFDVIVSVHVHCADCGSTLALDELLARRRCECERSPS